MVCWLYDCISLFPDATPLASTSSSFSTYWKREQTIGFFSTKTYLYWIIEGKNTKDSDFTVWVPTFDPLVVFMFCFHYIFCVFIKYLMNLFVEYVSFSKKKVAKKCSKTQKSQS